MIGVRVFWALVAGFGTGIALRSLFILNVWHAVLLVVIAFIGVVAVRGSERVVVACALFACALGMMRMDAGLLRGDTQLNARIDKQITLTGVITAEPDDREGSSLLTIAVSGIASSTRPVHATVLAVAPARTRVAYGDRVRVSGVLKVPEPFEGNNGRVFDYPGYLAAQGIGYQLAYAKVQKQDGWFGNPVIAAAIWIKEMFVRGIDRALSEPEAGLAAGITAGDKRGLGQELTDDFRAVSLVHIIVLSGYNITIVIAGLYWVCERLRAPRVVRFGSGIMVAIFFSLMTGFAAASLRASIMALIAISGEWSGRVYRADRALGVATFLMLLWNPYSLMFDPGFQLSILATVGLMAFSSLIDSYAARFSFLGGFREIVVSTMSAQLAVLPLLLYSSGQLSLVALPANLLVLFVVPPAMLATLIAALAGITFPFFAPVIGFPAFVLLHYIIFIARTLSHVPFATLQIPPFSAWMLIPLYAALLVIAYLCKQKAPSAGLFVGERVV